MFGDRLTWKCVQNLLKKFIFQIVFGILYLMAVLLGQEDIQWDKKCSDKFNSIKLSMPL